MGIVHLKGSMLAEYLDGRLDDRSIRDHVEGCELCKARLRDDRMLRALLGPGGSGESGAHVDDEMLAAYHDQGFEPSRMRAIDRHLAHCDQCLVDYLELKKRVDAPAREPLPQHLRELAVETLGPRALGTLYLSVHGDRVLAFFMAETEHEPVPAPPPSERKPRRAAASSQRPARRMSSQVEEFRPGARYAKYAASISPDSLDESFAGGAGNDVRNRVVIPVDEGLSLEITATRTMMDLRAVDPVSGVPREGVVVRIEYGASGGSEQATDVDGRAIGPVPPTDESARIVLPGPPHRAIDIQVS